MKRSFIPLFLLLLCVGCQTTSPPLPQPLETPAAVQQPVWITTLQQRAATLPAAQVTAENDKLTITYPQESLFSTGSILPLAGGAEALDPLADLLRTHPEATWNAHVRAATTNGAEYDLALAQKRSELLQRYLRRGGVANDRISWQATNGDGIPLELTLLPPQPLTGSSPKLKE